MRANFGSCLDHLSNEMCQMNTRIDRITPRQSRLGGFGPFPSPKSTKESFSSGDDDDDIDGSSSYSDDEVTMSQ